MSATYAVGSVRGHAAALDALLAAVGPDLVEGDELVFVGGLIGEGPDSRACVERVLRLEREILASVVVLLGEDEEAMFASLEDPTRHTWVLAYGGLPAIASYATGAADLLRGGIRRHGLELATARIRLPYTAFFEAMPLDHAAFFRRMPEEHRTQHAICRRGKVLAGLRGRGGPTVHQFPYPDGEVTALRLPYGRLYRRVDAAAMAGRLTE